MLMKLTLSSVVICLAFLASCTEKEDENNTNKKTHYSSSIYPIAEKYKDVQLIDAHNHDASAYSYRYSLATWDSFAVDQIVLFGDISEPSAKQTDEIALSAYDLNPDRYIPFIAGVNIHDSECLEYVKEMFDKGAAGIGEVVGASLYSPICSKLPWKGEHPLDGYFPEIYELCAQYRKPILLHIDPPNGFVVEKLEEAAQLYPNTNFIFGHANAYNSPQAIRTLLEKHDNIYIDFFAGFTAYNKGSQFALSDFVPVINDYPDKFFVSTDSAYEIGYKKAYSAIYELFDLLNRETVVKIAGQNLLRIID